MINQMKKFHPTIKHLSFILILVTVLSSCSKTEESELNFLVGIWSGERVYDNPVGGTKSQYLTISFYADFTGELIYEGSVSYSTAAFVYSINGNQIVCRGAYVNSDGDVDENYTLILNYDGRYLRSASGQFQDFVLTNGNYPIPDDDEDENDSSGNSGEVSDLKNLVFKNVSVTAYYQEYEWHVEFRSTLEAVLPGKQIKYEVGHGIDSEDTSIRIESSHRPVIPSVSYSGNTKIISMDYPLQFFFVALGNLNGGDFSDAIATIEMYLASYKALKDKIANGEDLSKGELSLLSGIKEELADFEADARIATQRYTIYPYVSIDGTIVGCGSFTIK